MRFCPFCSAENADELAVCGACGRRLPPLPPRRARNAPPTGVQLPPRATTTMPPATRKPATIPPPAPAAPPAPPERAATVNRESAPALPPPPTELANALSPSPAAQRREAPPAEIREGGARRTDQPKAVSVFDDDFNTQASAQAFEEPVTTARPAGRIPSIAAPGPRTSAPMAAQPAPRSSPGVPILPVPPISAPMPAQPGPRSSPISVPPPLSAPMAAQPGPRSSPGIAVPPPTPISAPMAAQSGPRSAPSPSQPPPISAAMAAQPAPVPVGDGRSRPVTLPPAARPPLGAPRPSTQLPVPEAPPPSPPLPRPFGDNEPPPTRIQAPLVDRPFAPPKVLPIPEIPEPGLVASARYAVRFGRARWQRRGAIKLLGIEIKQDTEALDQVLGALGRVARTAKIEGRVFSAENAAISAVEERIVKLGQEGTEVDARRADENSKFIDVERERNSKLADAEKLVEEVQRELATLETQRKNARDKRKELERRQRAYLKAAEDNEKQSSHSQMGDQRQELRRSAEQHRKEAAALEPDRQEIDRRLAALEKPIGDVTTKLDAAKAELDAAKRSLNDAREGHTHRLAELDAEQKRKGREVTQAEGEIARRLVTLGTLVNLNRIEDPRYDELYQRIDRLRTAITSRTTEIEKLAAEREAYDRGTLLRGIAAMGGAFVAFIALIVILRAVL